MDGFDYEDSQYMVKMTSILKEGYGFRAIQDMAKKLEEKSKQMELRCGGLAVLMDTIRTVVWSDMDDSEKIHAIKDIVGEEKTK